MEDMTFVVDWELEFPAFKKSIRELIRLAEKKDKVIPLPFTQGSSLPIAAIILSQVNCDGCDARCCKSNPPTNEPLGITMGEYRALVEKFGESRLKSLGVKSGDEVGSIPMPCPFRENNRCGIYSDRPLICVLHPLEIGGTDGEGRELVSLGSRCPEARRIAKGIYVYFWRLRRQFLRARLSEISKELKDNILRMRGINV